MTAQQALQLLDQNIANLSGSREAHVTLQEAVFTLQNFINEHPQPELPNGDQGVQLSANGEKPSEPTDKSVEEN